MAVKQQPGLSAPVPRPGAVAPAHPRATASVHPAKPAPPAHKASSAHPPRTPSAAHPPAKPPAPPKRTAKPTPIRFTKPNPNVVHFRDPYTGAALTVDLGARDPGNGRLLDPPMYHMRDTNTGTWTPQFDPWGYTIPALVAQQKAKGWKPVDQQPPPGTHPVVVAPSPAAKPGASIPLSKPNPNPKLVQFRDPYSGANISVDLGARDSGTGHLLDPPMYHMRDPQTGAWTPQFDVWGYDIPALVAQQKAKGWTPIAQQPPPGPHPVVATPLPAPKPAAPAPKPAAPAPKPVPAAAPSTHIVIKDPHTGAHIQVDMTRNSFGELLRPPMIHVRNVMTGAWELQIDKYGTFSQANKIG